MPYSPSPVLQNERTDILDILRGFALLGVMIDNLFGFSGWGFITQPMRESLATWPADGPLAMLEQVFINGKFYSLFSLLFGIGFSIILIRNEQRGINPLKIFYRRLFILLLIGAGHLFLLWEGDILLLYALIGFVLPLFRKCSDSNLLIIATLLIFSPLLFDAFSILFQYKNGGFLESLAQSIDKKTGLPTDDSFGQYLYKDGAGWQEWRNWQASGWAYRYAYIIDSNRIPKVLGMFLIGFWAGRKMIYTQLDNYTSLFKKLRFWGLLIGIPAGIASFYFEFFQKKIPDPVGIFHTFFYAISVVPLCLAYTSMICLHWLKRKGNTSIKYLAPMGRMALTNYLMQTVLGIGIYYGIGLGLGGNKGPVFFISLGLVVYFFQVVYSNLWLRYFNYGPLEWIWRQLTYGKRLPLKNKTTTI